ncbi:hypothetical protein H6771_00040 [Candidatus Peribacteria bacterium]|nr:hypothetical protein [Candidatus Peribacteria bacterium]
MYRDIIRYRLAEGVTQEQLLQAAESVERDWMGSLPGFISWEIHRVGDTGAYMDIVTWESKESAKEAETAMAKLPADHPWYACYAPESITSDGITSLWTSVS